MKSSSAFLMVPLLSGIGEGERRKGEIRREKKEGKRVRKREKEGNCFVW